GIRHAQVLEEHVGHFRVVVLPRVHQDLPDARPLAQLGEDGRHLHEVGPGADHVEDLHTAYRAHARPDRQLPPSRRQRRLVPLPDDALVHYEVEPNYAGWTLAAYVAEKLKRPLPPDRLERLLRGRSLVHAESELLPETRIWPGLRFALRKRSPGDHGEPPEL